MKKVYKYRFQRKSSEPKKAVWLGLALLVGFILTGITISWVFQKSLPSLAQLHNIQPSLVTRVLDRNGELLKEFYNQRRILIPYDQIPPHLADCVLATEDRKFYNHWGVDIRRVVGAALHNLIEFDLTAEGASTITQQLARSLFLTPEKTLVRKIKEALTAIRIEQTYSKNEILELYLNQIYFGHGAYGIQAAAQFFFSKNASELSITDGALLIGLIKAPNRYSPIEYPDRAIMRRNIVLGCLADYGKVSSVMVDSLKKLPLEINPSQGNIGKAPYFTEMIRQHILETYGEEALYSSGIAVYTTLDIAMQQKAEDALFNKIDAFQAELESTYTLSDENYTTVVYSDSCECEIKTFKQLQGMLLAIDNKTGAVLAFVGGRDFSKSKFIRVTQALRQPGSAFKPFVFTAAIDNGFSPSDVILDAPIVLTCGGEEWRPANYDETFKGEMTLRDGLRESRNLIAIKLMMDPLVTPQQVVEYTKMMGIKSPLNPVPSLAIGSSEVTMWEMVPAFAVFPNGGIYKKPFFISKILDRYGNVKFENKQVDQEEVLSPQTAYIMTNMLETVVNAGTGYGIRRSGFTRPAGGKTGTTNNHTDNWFIGFVPQLTCGVWIAFDDKTKIGTTRGEVGATTALPVWAEFMKSAVQNLPVEDFPIPPDIYTATVCLESGELAKEGCLKTSTDLFTAKTLPKTECSINHKATRSTKENQKRFRIEEKEKRF